MARRRGEVLDVRRIVSLLASTDMTLWEISMRMGCSHSAIAAVNRRYQVRDYGGQRSHWRVTAHAVDSGVGEDAAA
jgi:hypothetical protein